MKILVTGFDPFGGESINPAWEAVKALPDTIQNARIIKLQIPTSFSDCYPAVEQEIEHLIPDVVLNVGQAGGRSQITIEKVAINLAEARIPDNLGCMPLEEALEPEGDTAYFATVPVKNMVQHILDHNIPAAVSYSAGTYVCNCLMYRVLHAASLKYPGLKAGFIHVPFSREQAAIKTAGTPFMEISTITRGLFYAIEAILSDENPAPPFSPDRHSAMPCGTLNSMGTIS